jgi:spore maturation protein CgeB
VNNKKVLILDGISGNSLGRDIHAAVVENGVESAYCSLAALSRIKFYKPKSVVAKLIDKKGERDSFFYLPKCRIDSLETVFEKEKPDIVLVVGFAYRFVDPQELKALVRKYQASLYLYDTDSCNLYSNRREFVFFVESELPIYEQVFSFSKVVSDFMGRKGTPSSFMPFGANPVTLPEPKHSHDVLFVGSGDLRRILLLEAIADRVSVFGSRWKRNYSLMSQPLKQKVTDRPIWGKELHQHMAGAKIILNITRGPFYAAETGLNLRIFEAMSAGAFMLTDYCDEVTELFEPGVEIETFRGAEELQDKVTFYLKNEKARLAVAKRGHQKYLHQFTWPVRVADMLQAMRPMELTS